MTINLSERHSLLQWLAPELARAGLLRNEDWIPQHAEEAARLFSVKPLAIAAVIMASIDRYAIDYLRQAPVLALVMTQGDNCAELKVRAYLAVRWLKRIREYPKLRELLKVHYVAPPLRTIKGRALTGAPGEIFTLKLLSQIAPSHLAQSIPSATYRQKNWLTAVTSWCSITSRRLIEDNRVTERQRLLQWAAFAIGNDPHLDRALTSVTSVADWAIACTDFNDRLTWQQALYRANQWHDLIAKESQEKAFLLEHKIGWDDLTYYGRLPDAVEIDDFQIVALRSGAELFAEGRAMRHCVASYSRDVIRGTCFIYSVRVGDRRVATVELSQGWQSSGSYKLEQLKGPCNARVSASIREAVYEFVKRINGR